MPILDLISKKLEENRKLGLYRKIPEFNFTRKGTESCFYFNKELSQIPDINPQLDYNTGFVNLATNDYLGLSSCERIKNSAKKAIDIYGTSSSSSFLIYGHTLPHRNLEDLLCEFKGGYERCMLYPSGYQANIGTIKALSNISPLKTFIAFDELSHASIVDGVLGAKVKFKSFKHNDLCHLNNILESQKDKEIKLIITEGVFSMDGDTPDLRGILNIAKKYDAVSVIDDAHATGTIGNKGGGSVDFHEVKPDIIVGTFGKALASNGAFVLSNRLIIEYLINFSRSFIFSTGIPPSSAAASLEALNIIKENPEIVKTLQNYSEFARNFLKNSGLNILNSTTHIIPVLIGNEENAVKIEKKLLKDGIYLKAVRYPTVAKGSARLRLGVNAAIDFANLKNVLKNLVKVVEQTWE
ncbi:MAG: pyridoxal phosphate-dependent aminotransferase family protein [Deltaproteobacteria bacterium]|nr:pyridoxal phosphate-dependent aminotransferase family protein [Deltaproteobacteria bacterium]MCL5892068.1 pyridoxal phosphate-dependent aminotransferase family protein [Deltaproteobacteria bacterium]